MRDALLQYLKKNKIDYKEHKHDAVFTVEQSKSNPDVQKISGLRTKSLFLKDESNNFYLITLPAEKRLDIKNLKSELNLKELFFASPEELKSELNVSPGSVSMFGIINSSKTELILDESIFSAEIVCFHPNINTSTLELNKKNIENFFNSLKYKKKIIKL